MPELVWTAAFDVAFQRAYERVEEHQPGAGERFHADISEALGRLQQQPRSGSSLPRSQLRRLLVWRRLYSLIYSVEPRGIILLELFDNREDPQTLARRLRDITGGAA